MCAFFIAMSMMILGFPDGFAAILVVVLVSGAIVAVIYRYAPQNAEYLTKLFIGGLLLRLLFGLIIHVFELRPFFGGDALTYDSLGNRLVQVWYGTVFTDNDWSEKAMSLSGSGWGMNYMTGILYLFTGRNILAAQSFCAVFGAATAPMVYFCAHRIFNNQRVGRIAALLVAVYPAFVIWSAQLLKDGLIIFLLVLAMTMVLKLQERINYASIAILILSMFGILSLRFYIFYMVGVAVVGSFVIGTSNSAQAVARRMIVVLLLGLGLMYLGVMRNANTEIEEYANLERIQRSRGNLAQSESGFGGDLDVSTTEGAVTALPIGFSYLMLAPFPWQIRNVRQAITLPEMIVWWCSIPFLFIGLFYAIKHRLRSSIAILLFSLLLTLGYSIFQGNVGTAYRQRTQIQVFLFIFIAAGWTISRERKENRRLAHSIQRQKLRQKLHVEV